MKIILLHDIKKIGRRNEIKNVSDGYATNFLFPKKLAMPATPENIAQRNVLVKVEDGKIEHLRAMAQKLEETPFEFKLKTGLRGEIFSSITKDDIKKAIAEKYSLEVKGVELHTSIKKLGDYEVEINLGKGITAKIKICVCG